MTTRAFADERDVAVVSRLVNQIVVVLVALVVAFCPVALVITDAGPPFSGEATLLNVFGYLGPFASMVLMLCLTVQIIREDLH